MAGERVLITGGSGFIGSALAIGLAACGYEVVALTRRPESGEAPAPGRIVSAHWDGRTAADWSRLAEGAMAVVNLAGDSLAAGRWTRAKKDRIVRSRVDAGAAVAQAFRLTRTKPRALVQASAVGVYGPRADEELDEASAPGRGFLADVCRRWEASAAEVRALGVRCVVVRSGLVLGRNGGVWPRLVLPFRFFAGGPLGSGRQWFSWISLEDEVGALRFLIEHDGLEGTFNLTAPAPVRQRELCRIAGSELGRPCWLPVPAFILRALFGEKAGETLLSGQRVLPRRLLAAGFTFRAPDAATAVAGLVRRGSPWGSPSG